MSNQLSDGLEGTIHNPETAEQSAVQPIASFIGKSKKFRFTDEIRRKISESKKGLTISPEARAKISAKLTGLKQSPETIEKRRQKLLGHAVSPETRAKISAKNKANRDFFAATSKRRIYTPHSPETRAKISASKKGIPNLKNRGDGNAMWKGGNTGLRKAIQNLFLYRQWRDDVFHRDDFICYDCGIRGGKLNAHHHPVPFYKVLEKWEVKTAADAEDCAELWDTNNGITLCNACHLKRHSGEGHWTAEREGDAGGEN